MSLADQDLSALLYELESDRVERKASLTAGDNKERIREAICAFANDLPDHRQPGILFIGANDNGTCTNLSITDQLLTTLAQMRDDGNILPLPTMFVERRILGGGEFAVITVLPSDSPPVRYKGRVHIRVGPRRAIASSDEERLLSEKRRFRDLPFDARPAVSAKIEDLDEDYFIRTYLPFLVSRDILDQNQRTYIEQLASAKFATAVPEPTPTNCGLVVIGREPSRYIPGAYLQFVRFGGTNMTDPVLHQDDIHRPLSELLFRIEETLAANITVAAQIAARATQANLPDYPVEALRQLVRNAVLHRNYETTNAPVRVYWFSDRIEIHSPGGPYGQVRKENFGAHGITDYRNPNLAEAMKVLGYVQKFGMGIPLARQALAANGNPPLEFLVEDTAIAVIVRRQS